MEKTQESVLNIMKDWLTRVGLVAIQYESQPYLPKPTMYINKSRLGQILLRPGQHSKLLSTHVTVSQAILTLNAD